MSFITSDLNLIISQLQQGEIAAIPTETVYGLAADYANPIAIEKIFQLKQRPSSHPLILHILPEWDLEQWVLEVPELAKTLIQEFWPGPLSLVFKAKINKICSIIRANQATVAIRAPQHPLTQELLKKLGRPIVAPSANPFEKLSPTTAEHVLKHFPNAKIPILDGGRCQMGIESTIIDVAYDLGRILRPGQIRIGHQGELANKISVPGQHLRHYQPHTPCFYFENFNDLPTELGDHYLMCFNSPPNREANYEFPKDITDIYYEFYYQLQVADEARTSCILIEMPKANDNYTVIRERIFKAAQAFQP
jgi:L-threonylcarbamoyladenylate synthase